MEAVDPMHPTPPLPAEKSAVIEESPKLKDGVTKHDGILTDDSDSDITDRLSAAGINVHQEDEEPGAPCSTVRMWVIGIVFCLVGCSVNTLFEFRCPTVTLKATLVLFLAYPVGKFWEKVLPDWTLRVAGCELRLNPGPFNRKEHLLIYIMSNLSIAVHLSADILIEELYFYGKDLGYGYQILFTFSTMLVGFSLAGLFRSVTVNPPSMVWPSVLSCTALCAAFHGSNAGEAHSANGWKISRYGFFGIAFCISFVWYWLPDLIFPALGYFTFICWIVPKNAVVNQLFGMKSGIGLLPFTFDWSQIAYLNSPLLLPTWAIVNIFAALVFWVWIITPALYYSNVWNSAYFPIESSKIYDNTGSKYETTSILNSEGTLNVTAYEQYSPVYLPVTYALSTFGLGFATVSCLIVGSLLDYHRAIRRLFCRLPSLISNAFTRSAWTEHSYTEKPGKIPYKDVPKWWYMITAVLALFLAMFVSEFWDTQLRWYGALLAVVVATVLTIPASIVCAQANARISIDVFCRMIAGFLFPGSILANINFSGYSYVATVKAMNFGEDLKLGIYCRIPPRTLFSVQICGMICAALSQVGLISWALHHIPDICTSKAPDNFNCKSSKTHYNTATIWGAIGPQRFLGEGSTYQNLLYFFLVGAILPFPVYYFRRKYPNSMWKYVRLPLLLGGLTQLPPATGTNYSSWAIVGLAFSVIIKRKYFFWWKRYNFVLSSALDCSVAVAAVVIYFAITYTGAADKISWWGTKVHENTCDWNGCPYKELTNGQTTG